MERKDILILGVYNKFLSVPVLSNQNKFAKIVILNSEPIGSEPIKVSKVSRIFL